MTKISDCWVVMPTGGSGMRLRPLTENTSKALVPFINYFPATEFVLFGFAKQLGVRNVVFGAKGFVNYRDLKSYFEGGFGWSAKLGIHPAMNFEYQDPNYEDLGSADGVLFDVKKFEIKSPIVVVPNDQLYSMDDIEDLYEFTMNSRFSLGVGLTKVEAVEHYGIADLNFETGEVVRFIEKPRSGEAPSRLANSAIYVIKPEIFDDLEGDFGIDTLPKLVRKGRVGGKVFEDRWFDLGNTGAYLDSFQKVLSRPFDYIEEFLSRVYSKVPGTEVYIRGLADHWEKQAGELIERIKKGEIKTSGKVLIGKEVFIGDGTELANCSIGDLATIDGGTKIVNSNLMDAVNIGEGVEIVDCVIGRGGNVLDFKRLSHQVVGHGVIVS